MITFEDSPLKIYNVEKARAPQQRSVVVTGHFFKHVKRAEALQRQTLSYKQAASSIPKLMKHPRNSNNYYRRKKTVTHLLPHYCFSVDQKRVERTKSHRHFSPHIL